MKISNYYLNNIRIDRQTHFLLLSLPIEKRTLLPVYVYYTVYILDGIQVIESSESKFLDSQNIFDLFESLSESR